MNMAWSRLFWFCLAVVPPRGRRAGGSLAHVDVLCDVSQMQDCENCFTKPVFLGF